MGSNRRFRVSQKKPTHRSKRIHQPDLHAVNPNSGDISYQKYILKARALPDPDGTLHIYTDASHDGQMGSWAFFGKQCDKPEEMWPYVTKNDWLKICDGGDGRIPDADIVELELCAIIKAMQKILEHPDCKDCRICLHTDQLETQKAMKDYLSVRKQGGLKDKERLKRLKTQDFIIDRYQYGIGRGSANHTREYAEILNLLDQIIEKKIEFSVVYSKTKADQFSHDIDEIAKAVNREDIGSYPHSNLGRAL